MLVSGDVGKVALSTAPMVYHPVYLSEIVDMHAPWLCETSEVRMLGMGYFFLSIIRFFQELWLSSTKPPWERGDNPTDNQSKLKDWK